MSTTISSEPLAGRACKEIEKLITTGELGPGARISENLIAARLGVSRGPVREACRMLAAAGLVTILPRQGTFVRALTLREIVNLFDIRASLGRLAGREAAITITRPELAELKRLIGAMDERAQAGDSLGYIELNIRFHAVLYEATGNERLIDLDRSMGNELRIYRRHGLAAGGGLAVSNQEHRVLVECLERGDAVAAGEQLEQHIVSGRDRFIRAMAASGDLVLKSEPARSENAS